MVRIAWVIVLTTFMHLVWGSLMLWGGIDDEHATGGAAWNVYVEIGGLVFWGWAMLGASALAALAFFSYSSRLSVVLCLPQQAILTVGAFGWVLNVLEISETHFESNLLMRVAPHAVGLFVVHSLALIEVHSSYAAGSLAGRMFRAFKAKG